MPFSGFVHGACPLTTPPSPRSELLRHHARALGASCMFRNSVCMFRNSVCMFRNSVAAAPIRKIGGYFDPVARARAQRPATLSGPLVEHRSHDTHTHTPSLRLWAKLCYEKPRYAALRHSAFKARRHEKNGAILTQWHARACSATLRCRTWPQS